MTMQVWYTYTVENSFSMNIISSIFLGFLQGLTEFLPVSSSGHLILVQSLIPGFSQPGVLFDVFLHFGTFFAVVVFFWKEIIKLPLKYYLYLVLGTIPAAFIGYFFQSQLETLFTSTKLIGFALLVTGVANLLTDRMKSRGKKLSFKNSFITGVFQAIAIIPGVSRSGTTIFASVAQGVDKKSAAKFSFLLSIPAVLGANILEFTTYGLNEIENYTFYLTGFVFSFASGLLAIYLVFKFLTQRKFKIFAYYCFFLGILAILL